MLLWLRRSAVAWWSRWSGATICRPTVLLVVTVLHEVCRLAVSAAPATYASCTAVEYEDVMGPISSPDPTPGLHTVQRHTQTLCGQNYSTVA